MKSNYKQYYHNDSANRIDEILNAPAGNFEQRDAIPSRDSLTYTNGFYVNVSCLYMDMKDSTALPSKYKRPTLAKIYRSCISEAVAILNASTICSEVNIHGDAVWGVFESKTKDEIVETFSVSCQLGSLIKLLNCRYKKKGIDDIKAGIGMGYGRALMIKAGFKGSSNNEVVWMGDVVNGAAKMCKAAKEQIGYYRTFYMCATSVFRQNLNDHSKEIMSNQHCNDGFYYGGSCVNTDMDSWYKNNCEAT